MKTREFLILSLVFLAPLIAAERWLDVRLAAAPNSYAFKRAMIEREAADARVLVMGSSHGYFDYNPAEFSAKGLNLANTSQGLMLDNQILWRFENLFKKVKVIVVNLDVFSFEYRLYGQVDDYREFQYRRVFGIHGDGWWWPAFSVRDYSSLAAMGPAVAKKILFENFGANLANEISPLGWLNSSLASYPHSSIGEREGRARAAFHVSIMDPGLVGDNFEALELIADTAKRMGAKLVLAQAPVTRYYQMGLDPAALARFHEELRNISRAVFDAKVVDYTVDPRFTDADFYDNDHLNAGGAAKFSRIFDREVLAPLLADE